MASPKVWTRFSVTKETGTVTFCTIEPPQDRLKDVVEFTLNYLAKEEAFFKGSGVARNEEALAEYKDFLLEMLTDGSTHTVICCLDDNNVEYGEIVGVSFIALSRRDKPIDIPKKMPQTQALQKLLEIVFTVKNMYNICGALNVDIFYDGRGVAVHPKYRGYGIAQELFRTRRLVCKDHNVPLTAAIMTAYGSQKAAERDNWETVFEFNFQDFGKHLNVTFEGPETVKLMVARVS